MEIVAAGVGSGEAAIFHSGLADHKMLSGDLDHAREDVHDSDHYF